MYISILSSHRHLFSFISKILSLHKFDVKSLIGTKYLLNNYHIPPLHLTQLLIQKEALLNLPCFNFN